MARSPGGRHLVQASFSMICAAAILFLFRFLAELDSDVRPLQGRLERISTRRVSMARLRARKLTPDLILVYSNPACRSVFAPTGTRGSPSRGTSTRLAKL
jgi:hypothetical protein